MLYLLRTISPSRSCSPPSSSLPPFLFSHSSYFTLIVLSGLALWLIGLCVCVCLITGMLCFSCVIYVLPVGYLSVCVPKVQGRWCIFNYMCTYVCGCTYLSVCVGLFIWLPSLFLYLRLPLCNFPSERTRIAFYQAYMGFCIFWFVCWSSSVHLRVWLSSTKTPSFKLKSWRELCDPLAEL